MILDQNLVLSDGQAITATAASTNIIDLSVARDVGPGYELPLLIQVGEAFNNLTSLTIDVQTDDNSSFSSPTSLASQVIPLAALTVGAKSAIQCIPVGTERYLRVNYTVTGTAPTTGKVTAAIVVGDVPNWKPYASGLTY